MKRALLMPKLGLTMTEGALVEWSVRPGQAFVADATLFVVETEKTATDVPAEAAGTLVEIVVDAGVTVPVGTVLGHWDDELDVGLDAAPRAGATKASSGTSVSEAATPSVATNPTSSEDTTPSVLTAPSASTPARPRDAAASGVSPVPAATPRIKATPLARRIATQRGVDLATVTGSGPNGRIRAADVEAFVVAPRPASPPDPVRAAPSLHAPTPAQATIARRLGAAKRDIPHFYLAVEAEVSKLVLLREELKAARPALRYTLNHFVLAAVGRALVEVPAVNAVWTDDGIVRFATSDVGMAVSTDRGLVAPVLRDVGHVPLASLATQAATAIERAKAGRLTAAAMEGGAVTVSNAGMHDVTYMTSIINPGQSLILGVGSVRELFRPDAQGQPALRREMGLVLSADHRVHDAVGALAFLKRVVAHLEQPLGLLL